MSEAITEAVQVDPRALRAYLGAIVERALTMLDQLDGECDLEDGHDDEPYLACAGQSMLWQDNSDREADDSDDEPSLGWITTERGHNFTGLTDETELEDEHDEDGHDQEDDRSDLEPSLGWARSEAETGTYATGWNVNQDLEDDGDDLEPEIDGAVDDLPCDDFDEGQEPEPWHWRAKQRTAAKTRYAKRWNNVTPIIAGPYGDCFQIVKIGGAVNG